jgi:hypothetical protein
MMPNKCEKSRPGKPPSTASVFKTAVMTCGGIAFLVASIVVAFRARHYQISGEPMPNGKGGFMNSSDGYLIAAALFAISIAWFLAARRFSLEKTATLR